MKKQLLSLVLAISMVCGLFVTPMTTYASDTKKGIMPGANHLGNAGWEYLYFGTYEQDSTPGKDPIFWDILYNETDKLFLFSEGSLDVMRYHKDVEDVTWETSTIRSWLNGYPASYNIGNLNGVDYTYDNFIDEAFNKTEQTAILSTSLTNNDNPEYGTDGGNDTVDKIFLLSIEDMTNRKYGYVTHYNNSLARLSMSNYYTAAGGKYNVDMGSYNIPNRASYYYLRTPGSKNSTAAVVTNVGNVQTHGLYAYLDAISIRPALNLDKSAILFTSAAIGGKASTSSDKIFSIPDYKKYSWKTTLLSSERTFNANMSACNGDILTVDYTGAIVGTNEYISVILEDSTGSYTHYGRIENVTASSGTVQIDLSGIDTTDKNIYVFNEQYNGGPNDDTMLTDYASKLILLTQGVTVSFDINGHGSVISDVNTYNGAKITEPSAPSEIGYIFDGWFKQATCQDAWNFASDTVAGDMTLFAKWTACDHTGSTNQPDCENDAICSLCGATLNATGHSDVSPKDHICDNGCGKTDIGLHQDAIGDGDHNCDYCGDVMSACVDVNKNHQCDECGASMGVHEDLDYDHQCDYGCSEPIGEHSDNDSDHNCDYCGAAMSACVDLDKDHQCDQCGTSMGVHEDLDYDHQCDYGCSEPIGEHSDNDSDHNCDYCGAAMSVCVDANMDHQCDICGALMGTHEDLDKDHKCDYGCSEVIGEHQDNSNDHNCDYCGEALTACVDDNKDHQCDMCGANVGNHEDLDKDHQCDYGCDKAIGEHSDSQGDGDHECDYCGETLTTCLDMDKNHRCDECSSKMGEHEDLDKDHQCDYGCDVAMGNHNDASGDGDHLCDYCGKEMTACLDDNNDGICDECEKVLEYLITDGDNQVLTKGEETDVVIACNAKASELLEIQVDGKTLDNSNYTITTEKTVLTINKSYIEKLEVGDHSITFVYPDGTATAKLTIKAAAVQPTNPASAPTGDNTQITLWFSMMMLSLLAVLDLTNKESKKKASK